MRIYLDVCSYNRPFDNLQQDRVYLEAEAVLMILSNCQSGNWTLVGSDVINFETSNIKDEYKKEKVFELISIASEYVHIVKSVEERAIKFQKSGIKPLDSFHVALAENAKVDILLTTDDKLIKLSSKLSLTIKVENPLTWISEVL
jgi:predicted nucleic acid-binding protein